MKLVFPGGEHPQVLLSPGVSSVGSDPQATIVLGTPGILPRHCQLRVTLTGVMLEVPQGTPVSVNDRPVEGFISLRPGDCVRFDQIVARLASLSSPESQRSSGSWSPANDDPGMTAVRKVMPTYVLRGLTGSVFGRTHPVEGSLTLGRSPQCDIHLEDSGLSRIHAKLTPEEGGLLIEDQNSTNGSFINGTRIQRQRAHLGDEVSFDSVRFFLTGSAHVQPKSEATLESQSLPRAKWRAMVIIAGISASAGAALLIFGV
ncbi:FHA domain-containing protein [Lysobacter tyrosinilyticus]